MSLPKSLTIAQLTYLDILQEVFQVQDASGKWIPYRLTNHQVWFHIGDVVVAQEKAKHTFVSKSRNTSFTTCWRIRELMSVSEFINPTVPFVRINEKRALHLIEEIKQQIKHMTPIILDIPDESKRVSHMVNPPRKKVYIPFDPAKVNMEAQGKIRFPNGTNFEAFPANAGASESIRGIRSRGSGGGIDESNFIQHVSNIFVAMRDANAGVDDKGHIVHQVTSGTTLKGDTEYSRLADDLKVNSSESIEFLYWPIFNPDIFTSYGYDKKPIDELIPFHQNDDLISLVHWHSKEVLWKIFCQLRPKFLEEYMAVRVDADYQWYSTELLLSRAVRTNVDNYRSIPFKQYHEVHIGVDPASINDMFAISILGKTGNKWHELYVSNTSNVELDFMERELDVMIQYIATSLTGNPAIVFTDALLVTIDATPIGLQMTQTLQRKYGSMVRGITGNKVIKTTSNATYKLNEFGHTELKRMLLNGTLDLVNDEQHIKHFQSVDGDFKIMRDAEGHGDSCMSTLYAILPLNLSYAHMSADGDVVITENTYKEESFKTRLDWYRKQKKSSKLRPAY